MKQRGTDLEFAQKLERGLVIACAAALASVWLLGEQTAGIGHRLAMAPDSPIVGGTSVIFAIIAIIVLNGWFIASETALNQLKNLHVKFFRDGESTKAKRIQTLLDSKQKFAAACTLGSQTARLALALISFLLAQGLALYLEQQQHWAFGFRTIFVSAAIIAVPVALVNLVLGEVVPKSFAALHPHRVALVSYRFIRVVSVIFSVPANVVVGLAGLFTARFGGRARLVHANQAEEEIKNLVESAEETGEIEKDEKDLLHSVFSFTDKVAREAMTPRVDMDALSIDTEPRELVRLIQESGHSRIPLYEGTDDQILGIVHAKDLLMALVDDVDSVDVRKLMRQALFIPENKDLHELLKEMRQGRVQMAVVQDEFGGTAGIVTVEDIVEELVGDITDEYDNEAPEIEKIDSGYIALGKTHVGDVNQTIGSSLSSEEFDTIGGYVFGLFGRQPKQDESIEGDDWRFTIAETDGRRILRIRLEKCDRSPAESPES